jgi:hypothetical protein
MVTIAHTALWPFTTLVSKPPDDGETNFGVIVTPPSGDSNLKPLYDAAACDRTAASSEHKALIQKEIERCFVI